MNMHVCMSINIKRVSSMWISISIKRMKNEYKCEYNRSISVITRRMSINTSISVNIRCMSIDMNVNIGVKHEGLSMNKIYVYEYKCNKVV